MIDLAARLYCLLVRRVRRLPSAAAIGYWLIQIRIHWCGLEAAAQRQRPSVVYRNHHWKRASILPLPPPPPVHPSERALALFAFPPLSPATLLLLADVDVEPSRPSYDHRRMSFLRAVRDRSVQVAAVDRVCVCVCGPPLSSTFGFRILSSKQSSAGKNTFSPRGREGQREVGWRRRRRQLSDP